MDLKDSNSILELMACRSRKQERRERWERDKAFKSNLGSYKRAELGSYIGDVFLDAYSCQSKLEMSAFSNLKMSSSRKEGRK